jgi:hypothetical protein
MYHNIRAATPAAMRTSSIPSFNVLRWRIARTCERLAGDSSQRTGDHHQSRHTECVSRRGLVVIGRLPGVEFFEQSSAFFEFGQRHLIPWPKGLDWIPDLVLAPLAVRVLGHLLLSRTAFGHRLYAIGGNRQAASLAGVQVGRVQVLALKLMGVLAALAAALSVAQSGEQRRWLRARRHRRCDYWWGRDTGREGNNRRLNTWRPPNR